MVYVFFVAVFFADNLHAGQPKVGLGSGIGLGLDLWLWSSVALNPSTYEVLEPQRRTHIVSVFPY